MACPHCGAQLWGVQYRGTPEDYDGVSEWRCPTCEARFGRWSGRELLGAEIEPRYGIAKATATEE